MFFRQNKINKLQFKRVFVFLCISILIFGIGFLIGNIYSQSVGRNIWLDDLPSTDFYVINTDDVNIWATRYDGKISFSGTDAVTVIQSAVNSLSSGRTWKQGVKINGNYTISSTILLPSYITLDLTDSALTLADGVNDDMIRNSANNAHDIEIVGGILEGNKNSQSSTSSGVVLDGVYNFLIRGVYVNNFYTHGIHLGKTSGRTTYSGHLTDVTVTNNGKSPTGGSGICLGNAGSAVSITIKGFYAEGNEENGISAEAGSNIEISDGVARDSNSDNGIYVANTMSTITISNAVVRNNGASGISIVGADVTLINIISLNNDVSGNGYHGIRIHSSANNTIVSNVVAYNEGGSQQDWGISEETTSGYVIISSSICYNNQVGDIKLTSSNGKVVASWNGTSWIP